MSNFIAIDASAGYLTAAAVKDGRQFLTYKDDCAMRHSVILMDEVDALLDRAGLSPKECDFFAAVTGPGSFTGIRIGIATVKGLADGAGKPAKGLTSFELAAYNINSPAFAVLIDAGREHFYAQGFGERGFAPRYITKEQASLLNVPLYGFGEFDLKNYTRLDPGKCLIPAVLAIEERESGVEALYVRKSQAEENR